jgi:hypothetical protein
VKGYGASSADLSLRSAAFPERVAGSASELFCDSAALFLKNAGRSDIALNERGSGKQRAVAPKTQHYVLAAGYIFVGEALWMQDRSRWECNRTCLVLRRRKAGFQRIINTP